MCVYKYMDYDVTEKMGKFSTIWGSEKMPSVFLTLILVGMVGWSSPPAEYDDWLGYSSLF